MLLDALLGQLGRQPLGEPERQALAKTVAAFRRYRAGETIVNQGERPKQLHLITEGWAVECQTLEDGARQITNFFLRGDLCDISGLGSGFCDSITSLTAVEVALLNRSALVEAMDRHPKIAHAILHIALSDQSILRTWVGCFGLRDKRMHLAHLLCELDSRLRRMGLASDHDFKLPLTQADLSDALGMSIVHTNRILQGLRRERMIELSDRRIRLLDPRKLRAIAEFDEAYLTI